MLNPMKLPADLVAALQAIPRIQDALESRLDRMDRRLLELPGRLEETLRGHFSDQREGIDELRPLLADNRRAAEQLPGKVDGLRGDVDNLRDELAGARDELKGLRNDFRVAIEELSSVRETVEPLRGPAERMGRLSERLPGQG